MSAQNTNPKEHQLKRLFAAITKFKDHSEQDTINSQFKEVMCTYLAHAESNKLSLANIYYDFENIKELLNEIYSFGLDPKTDTLVYDLHKN